MKRQDRFREWAAELSPRAVVLHGLLLALFFAAITAVLRIGGNLSMQRNTQWVAQMTFGVRIHHGYVGLLLLILAAVRPWRRDRRKQMCLMGIALVVSDALHHFVVLWIFTGAPEFNFLYH